VFKKHYTVCSKNKIFLLTSNSKWYLTKKTNIGFHSRSCRILW